MIDSKYFANYITNVLNVAGENYGVLFKVYADEGELKKDLKEYGKHPQHYTSGLATITNTQLLPIRGLKLNTYTVEVELFVDILREGFENDESVNLNNVRNAVVGFVESMNGSTGSAVIDEIDYSQSLTVGYPTTGTKSDVGFIADCLPLYLTLNFALFQEGLNANECKLYVNGEELPFTTLAFTRKKTAESNTFNGETETSTIMQMNGLSIDGVVPARKNDTLSTLIMEDILNGSNYALLVKVETPVASKVFIGTFGDTVASLDIATNIGYNFSIVKGEAEILDFDYGAWGSEYNTQPAIEFNTPRVTENTKYLLQCTGKDDVIVTITPRTTETIYYKADNVPYSLKVSKVVREIHTDEPRQFTQTLQGLESSTTYRVYWGDGSISSPVSTASGDLELSHLYTDSLVEHDIVVTEIPVVTDKDPVFVYKAVSDEVYAYYNGEVKECAKNEIFTFSDIYVQYGITIRTIGEVEEAYTYNWGTIVEPIVPFVPPELDPVGGE